MKLQCTNIEPGENVHKHHCNLCHGFQHVHFITLLSYQLNSLCVLSNDGKQELSDAEIHKNIEFHIQDFIKKYELKYEINFQRISMNEPISTLRSCIDSLTFKKYSNV